MKRRQQGGRRPAAVAALAAGAAARGGRGGRSGDGGQRAVSSPPATTSLRTPAGRASQHWKSCSRGIGGEWHGKVGTARGAVRGRPPGSLGSDGMASRRRGLDALARPGGGGWTRRAGAGAGGGTSSAPRHRAFRLGRRRRRRHPQSSASWLHPRRGCQQSPF